MSLAQTKTASNETPRQNLLLVVNQGDRSMSLVDPEAGVQVGKVKTNGVRAHEVTASPDRRLAYLPIYGNSGVGKPGTDGASVKSLIWTSRPLWAASMSARYARIG